MPALIFLRLHSSAEPGQNLGQQKAPPSGAGLSLTMATRMHQLIPGTKRRRRKKESRKLTQWLPWLLLGLLGLLVLIVKRFG